MIIKFYDFSKTTPKHHESERELQYTTTLFINRWAKILALVEIVDNFSRETNLSEFLF